jgi:hypothetical protein
MGSPTPTKRLMHESPEGEPFPTRLKPNTPLESVVNDLSDVDHKSLDKEIRQAAPDIGVKNLEAPSEMTLLLTLIIKRSKANLDNRYLDPENAASLLNQHPALAQLLRDTWADDSKSFQEIRNLSELHHRNCLFH